MPETKTDLQHLLEDLRDQYPFSIEEAIITEVTANSLDAGATRIRFLLEKQSSLTIIDDGSGMDSTQFERYHDIAASTKAKGEGIGFAGVGAKLALLYKSYVRTETKRPGFHRTSIWHLDDQYHAPYEFDPPTGLVTSESGTAVTIVVDSTKSPLLNPDFITGGLKKHFYPLFDRNFETFMRVLYPGGVQFEIDSVPIVAALPVSLQQQQFFQCTWGGGHVGKGARKVSACCELGATTCPMINGELPYQHGVK